MGQTGHTQAGHTIRRVVTGGKAAEPRQNPRFDAALRLGLTLHLRRFYPVDLDGPGLRRAVVCVVILASSGGFASTLVVRRTRWAGRHAGQWGLPGGTVDNEETDEAALRELKEEVGLDCKANSILARLDDGPTRSGFRIRPFVVWCDSSVPSCASPAEVESLHLVPLAALGFHTPLVSTGTPPQDRRFQLPVDGLHVQGGCIYALAGQFSTNFVRWPWQVVRPVESTGSSNQNRFVEVAAA